MTAIFIVYSAYVWTHGTAAPQSIALTEQVQRGQHLYQAKNCTACHQFYGLGGYMGPDLTNVISNKGPAYAAAFLGGGTVRMPNFEFTQQEIDDLVSFLEFVDSMGNYHPPSYQPTWLGTVAQLE
jgi:nitric oxide reductase subunit C